MSETPNEGILRREFPASLESSGDGRTLEVRIVPYNVPTRVADPPYNVPYEEMWVEGAFDRQLSAPNRVSVFVNVEHEEGIKGIVGRGTELREVPGDGLHGTFRMLNHPDADKALELVNEGDLTGVSLEFVPLKSVREKNGLVKRVKARLVNIALVRPSGATGGIQAYKDAGVLAVRQTEVEAPPEGETDAPEPDAPAPDEPTPEDSVPIKIDQDGRLHVEVPKPVETISAEVDIFDPPNPGPSEVEEALARVGYEPLLKRAVVRRPWDGAASRFDDDQWRRSCILDRGDQFDTAKTRYAFPVLEPNGDLNVNGMHAAAARLNQAQAAPQAKAQAARRLVRLYRQAGEEPPPSLIAMAGR